MNKKLQILSDEPLENPEKEKDILGYSRFAKHLADTIIKAPDEECLIYAINGKWGTGKTTVLNFIIHYINKASETERPIIVKFNPWWFSGHGDLLNQFFIAFKSAIGKKANFKNIVNLIGDFANIISKVPEPKSKISAVVLSAGCKIFGKNKEASKIRDEIKQHLKKQKHKILVVIDDIDRLTLNEIRDLFRVIKAIADFPKTVYLLAFDREVVVNALGKEQGISGDDYLEKIIQVLFDLPMPDKTAIRNLFTELLNIIISDTPLNLADKYYWLNVFHDGIDNFVNSIRSAKRIVNASKVTYPIVKGEVNAVDFIALETIRVNFTDIYNLIKNNPDKFTGRLYKDVRTTDGKLKEFHDNWLKEVDEKNRVPIKNILMKIFPLIKNIYVSHLLGNDGTESNWRVNSRICSPEVFDIYFRLGVPEGEISKAEMTSILSLANNSNDFSTELLKLSKQIRPDGLTRVSAFLDKLEDYIENDIRKEHIQNIIKSLFNIGDDILNIGDEENYLFSSGNDLRIGRIIYRLLKSFESNNDRFNALKESIIEGESISLITREVSGLEEYCGNDISKTKDEGGFFISSEQFNELKNITFVKIKEFAFNDRLTNKPFFSYILHRWKVWEGVNKNVKEYVSQLISSDEGLVSFLAGFLSKSKSQSVNEATVKVHWYISIEFVKDFTNPDEIIDRCRTIFNSSPEWLKGKKELAVEIFIKSYELYIDGKDYKFL